MVENKIAKIPVASHGLHRHNYNYPWLSSINFGDVMPCYINTLRKGEKDSPKAGMYSQLMPIAHNAFATGRFNFKCIFVPYKLAWRPWYNFAEQTEFMSVGVATTPKFYPYVRHDRLSDALIQTFGSPDAAENHYDVNYYDPVQGVNHYHVFDAAGRRVLRVLGALGCMPSFVANDADTINILPILCYMKAFMDYYWPNNYVNTGLYRVISQLYDRDVVDFNPYVDQIAAGLELCSLNFYENSVFDLAWDNPVAGNVNNVNNTYNFDIKDSTDPDEDFGQPSVNNTDSGIGTPGLSIEKTNAISQYMLNALKSVTLWAKRHQLSGARLLDRFLVSRGVTLSNDSARVSYFLGQRNIEIQVSGVENNTDVNLGELAGRGIASSGDSPLTFDCKADDDGILLVVVSPLPDANFPVLLDGFATRKDYLDNYTAEFDKLGSAAVPSRIIQGSLNGFVNFGMDLGDGVFGFLNQYWDEVQERPRLLGDFILQARGAEELSAYHTFRQLTLNISRHHSFNFIRMSDALQYQRLFYSNEQENLMLFLRWYGSQFKEKLPLGDSYEWDDDEFNRKVSVVVGGSQK